MTDKLVHFDERPGVEQLLYPLTRRPLPLLTLLGDRLLTASALCLLSLLQQLLAECLDRSMRHLMNLPPSFPSDLCDPGNNFSQNILRYSIRIALSGKQRLHNIFRFIGVPGFCCHSCNMLQQNLFDFKSETPPLRRTPSGLLFRKVAWDTILPANHLSRFRSRQWSDAPVVPTDGPLRDRASTEPRRQPCRLRFVRLVDGENIGYLHDARLHDLDISPIPGTRTRQTVSAILMISTSDCPTPTVSMIMTS